MRKVIVTMILMMPICLLAQKEIKTVEECYLFSIIKTFDINFLETIDTLIIGKYLPQIEKKQFNIFTISCFEDDKIKVSYTSRRWLKNNKNYAGLFRFKNYIFVLADSLPSNFYTTLNQCEELCYRLRYIEREDGSLYEILPIEDPPAWIFKYEDNQIGKLIYTEYI